ncbi:MAG: hypothetical protein U1E45_09545 [Geminicoccaceae bacterium]
MQASEGLGTLGWACLAVVLLGAVLAVTFGFTAVFWIALILVPVVFVVLLMLCRGPATDNA